MALLALAVGYRTPNAPAMSDPQKKRPRGVGDGVGVGPGVVGGWQQQQQQPAGLHGVGGGRVFNVASAAAAAAASTAPAPARAPVVLDLAAIQSEIGARLRGPNVPFLLAQQQQAQQAQVMAAAAAQAQMQQQRAAAEAANNNSSINMGHNGTALAGEISGGGLPFGVSEFVARPGTILWTLDDLPLQQQQQQQVYLQQQLQPQQGSAVTVDTLATRTSIIGRAVVAGIMHGIAIHSKLYPVIYTVSFMAHISHQEHRRKWKKLLQPLPTGESSFPWTKPGRLLHLIGLWIQRLLMTPSSVLFLVISLSTFGGLTYLAVFGYGDKALEEGFLYHFSRVDHRHNYSMHWYWIYLARGRIAQSLSASGISSASASSSYAAMAWIGRVLLLPQAILLLYVSLGVAPFDLSFALFIQTFLFVAHNKVITAQYFTWYLCLLPLCSDRIQWNSGRMKLSLAYLGISVVAWLGSAFCLEMQGMPVHLMVWMASVNFFAANVNLLGAITKGYVKANEAAQESCDKKIK